MGNSDPEEGGDGDVHPHPPHVLGYGSVRRGRYSAQQQGEGARTYALQPISLSVPNPSVSGPRMHEYEIRAGRAGAPAVQVAPGSLSVRTPVMAPSHAVIGGSTMAASASASASAALGAAGVSSSRHSDSKSTTNTTSSASANQDVGIDTDIDFDDGDEYLHSNYRSQ